MRLLFLGRLIPDKFREEIENNCKKTMQAAAIELQKKMLSGLENVIGMRVDLINRLPIFSYPKYYTKPFVKKAYFKNNDQKANNDINLGFVNICYIKQVIPSFGMKGYIKKWLKEQNCEGYAVCYTADNEFLKGFKYIKKHSHVKTCMVIADLPEFCDLSSNISLPRRLYSKYASSRVYKKFKYVDSFVFLTEQMAEKLQIGNKPYIVVEGIATDVFESVKPAPNPDNKKVIFYGGTLHKQFGIMKLLDAFNVIEEPDYKLVLCGTGDCEEEIKRRAEKDSRIEFLGIQPHGRILELMAGATVIVNPRPNEGEFTKYSFPSKNLEALSSGVPFVAYKLDGIPDEYDGFINYPKSESSSDLADKIIEICSLAQPERETMGEKARAFVLDKKNKTEQMRRVFRMLDSLK